MILTWGRLLSKWRANVCLIQITIIYDNIMMVISNRSHLWPDHDDRANEWALGKEELPCPVDISSLRHSPVQPHLVSTYCPNVHPTVCALHSRVHYTLGPTPAECAITFIAILHQVCVTSILNCAFIAQFVLLALKLKSRSPLIWNICVFFCKN